MRRLISVLAAAALVVTPLATAGSAMAKDHHDQGARSEQHGRGDDGRAPGGNRGAPAPWRGGEDRGGGREYHGGYPASPYPNGGRGDRADPRYEQRADPRYDPRVYAPPPSAYAPAPRRGGYLAPQAGGDVVQDYNRFRLRPPPRGYEWRRVPGGTALVSRSGQVFDVVPD
ncbi:RcnB family protein [Phenylobacterium sp.]|uniref:RcnB family protein n=1 Tax=Phenylobacterium sp. TaxID=1871053 RepID=UPI0035632CFB